MGGRTADLFLLPTQKQHKSLFVLSHKSQFVKIFHFYFSFFRSAVGSAPKSNSLKLDLGFIKSHPTLYLVPVSFAPHTPHAVRKQSRRRHSLLPASCQTTAVSAESKKKKISSSSPLAHIRGEVLSCLSDWITRWVWTLRAQHTPGESSFNELVWIRMRLDVHVVSNQLWSKVLRSRARRHPLGWDVSLSENFYI